MENCICSAAFCESAALRLASSPSPSLLRKSTSPKGRGKGTARNFLITLKTSATSLKPWLSLWESWQARQGLTERAHVVSPIVIVSKVMSNLLAAPEAPPSGELARERLRGLLPLRKENRKKMSKSVDKITGVWYYT